MRTYEYNTLGNPTKVITDGLESTLAYNEMGQLTARTFENGRTVGYHYYPSGKRERVIDSLGGIVHYSYDSAGRIQQLADGGGRTLASYVYDPTTGLPAGILVQDQLRALMKDPEGSWALLRFRVRYLNPFRELYGFVAAKDLLRNVAHILAEALGSDDVSQDFLGYGGNDDFIVITTQERAPSLKDEVLARFKQEVHTHYGFMEAAAGHIEVEGKEYPLATLRVMIVTPKDGPFYDIRSLSEAIAG